MERRPTSGSSWRQKQVRKRDKGRFGCGGLEDRGLSLARRQGEISGKESGAEWALLPGVECVKSKKDDAKRGRGGAAWLSGSQGVPTPRCQHVKRWMEGGDERQAKRVETDLEGDKQRDWWGRSEGRSKGPSSFTVSSKSSWNLPWCSEGSSKAKTGNFDKYYAAEILMARCFRQHPWRDNNNVQHDSIYYSKGNEIQRPAQCWSAHP